MRSEVLVGCAHIFWRGWVAQPIFGLIAEARSPLLPLPALPQPPPRTAHNHAFVVLQLLDPGDREPQSRPVCLMCVCSSLCSSGAVFCNACVAHMMIQKNWNKTGLNTTMKSRTLQSRVPTSKAPGGSLTRSSSSSGDPDVHMYPVSVFVPSWFPSSCCTTVVVLLTTCYTTCRAVV